MKLIFKYAKKHFQLCLALLLSMSIRHLLSKRQIDCEDFIIFCGLLRKHELYLTVRLMYNDFDYIRCVNQSKLANELLCCKAMCSGSFINDFRNRFILCSLVLYRVSHLKIFFSSFQESTKSISVILMIFLKLGPN